MTGEPSATTAPVGRVAVPGSVNAAFWLYLAGAAVGVVSTVVGAVLGLQRLQASDLTRRLPSGTDVSPEVLNAAFAAVVAGLIAVGVISVTAYIVFALVMRRGANWARIVLTVLSAIALVSGLLGLLSLNLLNLVVTVLVDVAAVLLWQRTANAYFAARSSRGTPRPYA
jgi:hypothetical protein